MKPYSTPGTEGYAEATQKFIEATLEVSFSTLHRDFIQYIPKKASCILDVGAGIGRDAFVFSEMGHTIIAVEPSEELRCAGQKLFPESAIEWIDDSLPALELLGDQSNRFDFILASGVWHHLDKDEQHSSVKRIAQLLSPNGVFALTLRHGPAGAGTHIFPTSGQQTMASAEHFGLTALFVLENQPSLMQNKEKVFWTKLAFQKQPSVAQ